MKGRKIIAVLLVVANFILLAGCWSYREVNTLAIVAGFAIDTGKEGQKYHITFDTVDVGAGKDKPAKSVLIEMEGNSIFDATRKVIGETGKRLYFGDLRIIIVSNQIAKAGIMPALDWALRDHELRSDTSVIVSGRETAQEILNTKGLKSPIKSIEIDESIMEGRKLLAKAPYAELFNTYNLMSEKGKSLTLPVINTRKNMEQTTTELKGMAVFKKDRLIGYLDGEESRNYLFLTDQLRGGLYLVKQDSPLPDLTIEIKRCKTKVTSVCTGEQPRIKVAIRMSGTLDAIETAWDYGKVDMLKLVEQRAEKQLAVELKQTIAKVQGLYDSDIFGFGETIYKDHPKYWKSIESQWDELFPNLPVDITVQVKIQDTGILQSKEIGDES